MLCRLFSFGLVCGVSGIASAEGLKDYSQHTPPAITLPAALGSYRDPVFGTKIIRITDERDGTLCANADAYWQAFNADETRLLIGCDGWGILYRVDAATDTFVKDGVVSGDDGPHVEFEGATWSDTDPNILYALSGTKLYKVNVAVRGMAGATLLRDFTGLFDYDYFLAQMHMSSDARVFTFHSRDPATDAKLDVVAYDRSTDEVWIFPRNGWQIDESAVDKAGTVVSVDGAKPEAGFKLWSFRTGKVDSFDWNANDKPGGHEDLGTGRMVNGDVWSTGLAIRDLSDPHGAGIRNIVQYKTADGSLNWSIADHVSMRTDDERFVVGSTYAGSGEHNAFEDEIYIAYTDGTGFVRLAHTRSPLVSGQTVPWLYTAQPRASISRSGRYIVYSSNLESKTRIDVMVLRVPDEIVPPDAQPTQGSSPPTTVTQPPTSTTTTTDTPPLGAGETEGVAGSVAGGCNLAGNQGGLAGILSIGGVFVLARRRRRG